MVTHASFVLPVEVFPESVTEMLSPDTAYVPDKPDEDEPDVAVTVFPLFANVKVVLTIELYMFICDEFAAVVVPFTVAVYVSPFFVIVPVCPLYVIVRVFPLNL